MIRLRSLWLAVACALALAFTAPASAQQSLLQAGPRTSGHVPMYFGPTGNFGQPTLGDSGPASGGPVGTGLNELGLTVRGVGTPPFSAGGTGPFGANLCDYDAPKTNPTGYHYICLSPNAQGGESIIAGKGGSASSLPLQFIVNGVVTPITGTSVAINAGTNITTSGACSGTSVNCTINATGGGGGSGTVTSVGFTGGLISVGAPTTTPALTVAGTSGGVPYFASTSTWASSGLLAANALMIGGGSATAPSTTTTGTGVLTALGAAINASTGLPNIDGSITTGHCLEWGPGIQDAGAACGGGGYIGTVAGLGAAFPSPTEGQPAYVTDAISCVFGAGLTGGATGVPGCSIHWNGSAWTAG